jgi:hypothetical protein
MLSFVAIVRAFPGAASEQESRDGGKAGWTTPEALEQRAPKVGQRDFPACPWFFFIPPIKTFDAGNFYFELSLPLSAITL